MLDALVVGAGFAGLYAIHRCRSLGLDVHAVERAPGVGGTWWWNRYPGARCDIESLEYSYGFDADLQREWVWTERFATQPEILRYLDHVADRFDLRPHISLGTSITEARWHDDERCWHASADDGRRWRARHLVLATGALSTPLVPRIPGLERFDGPVVHTGDWGDREIELQGRSVAIIGTGSSAMQALPPIAEVAESVTVFQRTPNYAVPAGNRPLTDDERRAVMSDYQAFRVASRDAVPAFGGTVPSRAESAFDVDDDERTAEFERRWATGGLTFLRSFGDLMITPEANDAAAEFVRGKIDEIVDDPETAALLMPTHHIGCKRLGVQTDYFESFNRTNVELVDVAASPIERVTSDAIVIGDRQIRADVIVLATGFDAITGAITRIDPVGCGGRSITEAWADGPVNVYGLAVPDFPNMWTITGPGCPAPLTNVTVSIEHHVEWISDCIDWMRAHDVTTLDARPEAAAAWGRHVDGVAAFTLFPSCGSWYRGSNVQGKPDAFMVLIGFPDYKTRCDAEADAGYPAFRHDGGPR